MSQLSRSAAATSAIITEPAACISRLEVADGHIRKSGEAWIILAPKAASRPPLPVAADVVASLLARGHLVPRPGGGFETVGQSMKHAGRMTGHRPPRPEAGMDVPDAPTVNDAESPLAWLRSRKDRKGRPLLSGEQFLAGERLRADYERSCLSRRTTSSWDPSAAGGSGNTAADVSDTVIAARQNLQRALDAVGPELSGMLVQVCCLSAGIEQAERLLEMPQRSGKAVLGLALTSLARHYGYLKAAGGSHRRGSAHWGLPDFRPAIAPQAEG